MHHDDNDNEARDPVPGVYRHYKGKFYEVLGTATHSETGERLVVYRTCYGDRGLWVRPLAMFMETVEIEGREVPRFAPENEGRVNSGFGAAEPLSG